jgi:hypothetical protein
MMCQQTGRSSKHTMQCRRLHQNPSARCNQSVTVTLATVGWRHKGHESSAGCNTTAMSHRGTTMSEQHLLYKHVCLWLLTSQ